MSPGLHQVHKALAMAKSTGRDERPESTEDEAEDKPEDRQGEAGDDAAPSEEERDEGDDRDADGEEDKAAARPKPRAKAAKRPAPRTPPPPPVPPQGGAMGKSLLLFVVIVGGLAAAFAIFGQETGSNAASGWKPGTKAQVEITLVPSDKRDLACLSGQEVAGRHCAFEAPAKPWSKGDPNDDKMLLRPYTTVDRIQFLAAGVWSDPVLAGNLPLGRFSIKCTLNVEGTVKRPSVRWSPEGAWLEQTNDWHAGHVTGCKMIGATPE